MEKTKKSFFTNWDDCFKGMMNKFSKAEKYAFISCMVAGLLTHMYAMTNNFLNFDSMWNIYSSQDMISSGRQFLTYACGISSYFDLPWINGVLAIFWLALASVVLVRIFKIDNVLAGAMTGIVLVTFPAVTSTFFYSYTVDGYMLAVFLAVLSVYLAEKYKWGFIPSIFILGFSIGVYQAYFSLAIVLCMLLLLMRLLEEDAKPLLVKAAKFVAMGVGAYIFYLVTLKIMLAVKGAEMSGYQGSDAVNGVSLSVVGKGLKSAFTSFKSFILYENVLTTFDYMKWVFLFIAFAAAAAYIYLVIKRKSYKCPIKVAGGVIIIAMLPFATSLVAIISPNITFHLIMRMPFVLYFVFAVAIMEEFKKEAPKCKLLSKAALLATALLVWGFVLTANIGYFNMNERYEKTYATCVRIVDRLEQTPGYHTGDKVALLGGVLDSENYPETDITKEYLSGYFGVSGDLCINSSEKFAEFISHFLNVTITTIPLEEEIDLTQNEEFLNMHNFPAEDSIQKIGDVWVIRING